MLKRRLIFLALPQNIQAVFWLLSTKIFFSLMMTLGKHLGAHYGAIQVNFSRTVVIFILTIPLLLFRHGPKGIITVHPWYQLLRIVLGVTAMTCFFKAYTLLPLAQATVLQFTSALILPILAVIFLRDKIGLGRWIAIIIGYIGIIVTTWQDLDTDLRLAAGIALLGALCDSSATLIAKKISIKVPTLVFLFYSSLGSIVLLGGFAAAEWVMPTFEDVLLFILLGGISFVGLYSFYRAYRIGDISILAPIDYTKLIFMSAFGLIFFGEWPTWWTLAGALIIIGSNSWIAHNEYRLWRRDQPSS